MKRVLQRVKNETYYFVGGERAVGVPTGIEGNLTGIRGDLTGIEGDLSEAELTDEERAAGVNITDLIKEEV